MFSAFDFRTPWKIAIAVPVILASLVAPIYGAVCLVNWMLSQVPANEWAGLIKAAIVLVSIFFGLGPMIGLMFLVTAITIAILGFCIGED